jgi:hypothetical protein
VYVQFCSPSPRAGQREHVSQTTAAALIAAGLAREVKLTEEEQKRLRFGVKQPTETPTVKWSVTTGTMTKRVFVVATCSNPNCSTFRYEADPKFLGQHKFIHGCAGTTPETVPDDIVRAYAAAKRGEQPVETADMNDYANAMWSNPGFVKVAGKELPLRPEGI